MDTVFCFAYLEDKYFPDMGNGFCLQEHDEKGVCLRCDKVFETRTCPRKHTSPYSKEGERS